MRMIFSFTLILFASDAVCLERADMDNVWEAIDVGTPIEL